MWSGFAIGFALAVVSSICWASFDITRKHVGKYMSATAAVIGVMFFHAPFIAPFIAANELGGIESGGNPVTDILFVGVPEMSGIYLALVGGSVVLNLAANFLFLRSVQISPLGLTTPYLAFTPVFSAVTAFMAYSEEPTTWGMAGIATVCLGAFFLNPGNKDDGVLAPLKALWTERGSFYMLIVAALWSVTPIIDKAAAKATSPMWHTLLLATGVAGCFLAFRLVKDGGGGEVWEELKRQPFWLAASGLFAVGAMAMQLGSYEFIEVAYVETIKRAIGVTSAILAGYLFFDEGDLARRLFGAAVMTAGVAMVLLGG